MTRRFKQSQLESIQRDILKAVRGSKSCADMSRELGHKFNKYSRWESGETEFLFEDFTALCAVMELPLEHATSITCSTPVFPRSPELLLRLIFGNKTHAEIAEEHAVSRPTVTRWFSGAVAFPFLEFLKVLRTNHALELFLLCMFEPNDLPTLTADLELFLRQQEFVHRKPFVLALLALLECELWVPGRPLNPVQARWLDLFGVAEPELPQLFNELTALKLVELKDGILYRAAPRLLTHFNPEWFSENTKYWRHFMDVVANKGKEFGHCGFGYKIHAVSAKTAKKINDLSVQFNFAVSQALKDDSGDKSTLQILSFNLFEADCSVTKKS